MIVAPLQDERNVFVIPFLSRRFTSYQSVLEELGMLQHHNALAPTAASPNSQSIELAIPNPDRYPPLHAHKVLRRRIYLCCKRR